MHWVSNDLETSEKFLGFYEIRDIKSSTIVTVMKDILLRYQLNLDMCRGQCYDSASNMLGKSSAVATQIFAEQPKAHYTQCHALSLSLSVKDVTKNTKILRDTMGTAKETTILIKYSPKQENILGNIKNKLSVRTIVIFILITYWNYQKYVGQCVQYASKGFWITTVCLECLETLSPKRPDENRVKITDNRSQNTNGIFSTTFWFQSFSQNFFPYQQPI